MAEPELIFFYGTLMRPYPTLERLGVERLLAYRGWDAVAGRLYSLDRYPALTLEEGWVRGQVFELLDPAALAVLDRFEQYLPQDPAGSEYLRRLLPLKSGAASAWVYVFNRPTTGLAPVPDGDWAAQQGQTIPWDDFFASRTIE
ncbi:gamma-glutamylcyclotransferase family protein [Desulfoferula mesophila]|uniref:Gamma-glutamylcyclotransferase n=1 Tax=Desulfoferula mesophila TaxID=3058419 RepID=A0AAU9EEG9_9BACT|nr:gamma-glutamylcyclotransferase [Desulfoferula mesophilus]